MAGFEVYELLIGLAAIILSVWAIRMVIKHAITIAILLLIVAGTLYAVDDQALMDNLKGIADNITIEYIGKVDNLLDK